MNAPATFEARQHEPIVTEIFPSADAAVERLAGELVALVRRNDAAGQSIVLGLANGSTPVRLYRRST